MYKLEVHHRKGAPIVSVWGIIDLGRPTNQTLAAWVARRKDKTIMYARVTYVCGSIFGMAAEWKHEKYSHYTSENLQPRCLAESFGK